ncbi:MAG: efflux RND transporter permease subunit [bacterium]|nr:efflux RND transporter permease subunit [bacterium]
MSLYASAVKRPVMTSLCFVAVIILGLFSYSKLPIDLYPDIDTNTIMVMTYYTGASASDIEQNVSRPLENTLNSVEHLKHITSTSRENVSVITLEFEYGYDIDVLTNDVRDKLDMVSNSLPDEANTPFIFKFSTDMIPILLLSVEANESTPGLYKILDDLVANPLARVDGVGSVSVGGAPEREIYVYVDPIRLEAYNLTVEGIASIIGAENRNIPGGSFDIGNETYSLRVQGEFSNAKQMENIVVGTRNGASIYLRDVARVEDTLQERAQKTFNNNVQGGMIVIQKQSGANSVQISKKVKELLPGIQKTLPSDVKLGVIVDTSDNIINTINSLTETVLYALLFVVIVVFAFLGRWRATIIIVITIPISLIASFIYLFATGNSLNIISLSSLSISIGMVVDDAIVVLENVTTHIERGSDPKQAAVHGTNEVAISVIASTLTLIAVFFPLTLVTGMTGVLFKQLGYMVCIMMIISTTCALSLTPMLCSQLLRLRGAEKKGLFKKIFIPIESALNSLDSAYARLLNVVVRHKTTTILVCLGIFIGSMTLMKFIGSEFIPVSDNSRLGVTLELPIGARVERAEEISHRLYNEWKAKYPEIQVMNFTVGQAGDNNTFASLQDNGSHIISMNIRLCNPGERERGIVEIAALMREDLRHYPEFKKAIVNVGGSRGGSMSGQATLDYEIYGYDFAETDSVAQRVKRLLLSCKGASDITISRSDYQPEYQVDFDREKLALYGLNLSTAANYLRNRINGSTASYYREDGEEYDIKVMYAPEFRTSLEDIENILIYNSQGQGVRIKDVGKVVERFNPPTIQRKDRERIITVQATVDGVPMSQIVAEMQPKLDQLDIPTGITVELSGTYEDQQDSFADLAMLGIIIIILVYIVMAAQFESLTYPAIIMTSLLFALSGIILILWATGTNLNIMSMIGAIMLIGIVVKNGIVLIDYIILNRERGLSIRAAVVDAGRSRLRPIIMTALTTILGMVPMAVSQGEGAEMWRPMGIAVIGGLTFSTLLTLLFVPTLYCIFAYNGVKRQRRQIKKVVA